MAADEREWDWLDEPVEAAGPVFNLAFHGNEIIGTGLYPMAGSLEDLAAASFALNV